MGVASPKVCAPLTAARARLDRAVLRSYEDLGSPLAISEGSSPTLDLVAASPFLR